MSRRKYNISDSISYRQLSKSEFKYANISGVDQPDGILKKRTTTPGQKSPWKTVLFVIFFLIAGTTCIICSILVVTGYIAKNNDDRAGPLLILGILMFIPGGYYTYILGSILLKREGYTIDDMPTM